jgi:hypothetical protein
MSFPSGKTMLLTAALCNSVHSHVCAAQMGALTPGARVRVVVRPGDKAIVGKVYSVSPESIVIGEVFSTGLSFERRTFALSQLASLDRSLRSSTHGVIGALIGVVAGLGIGSAVAPTRTGVSDRSRRYPGGACCRAQMLPAATCAL